MDRVLLWAVQSQGQWRSISTELSPDRHRGRPLYSFQRSGGYSTIIEEGEVNWSWQHPSRTGPSRWRGRNYRSHDNLQQELPDRRGNLQQCQNYRTISLISHPSKVMLKIILNRLKPQAEKITAEEQARFLQEETPQSRSSTYESSVRNISSTSKISTMSAYTSKRPSTGFGMQLCGEPWRRTSGPT